MISFFKSLPKHIKTAFLSIFRHLAMSLSASSAVTVTLILFAAFLLIAGNVGQFTDNIAEDLSIHVQLNKNYTKDKDITKMKKELEAIAEAKGIDISKADRMSGRGSAVPPKARYSTLQDLDAGRHTEIDMFSGALMRMGKELGIPTPYNEYTYHMIKALEEKNDGRFAYTGEEEPTWSK